MMRANLKPAIISAVVVAVLAGLLLGAVAGKQVLARDEFKSAADSVALSSVTAQRAADDARAPRLAAFAQPMRFERQES